MARETQEQGITAQTLFQQLNEYYDEELNEAFTKEDFNNLSDLNSWEYRSPKDHQLKIIISHYNETLGLRFFHKFQHQGENEGYGIYYDPKSHNLTFVLIQDIRGSSPIDLATISLNPKEFQQLIENDFFSPEMLFGLLFAELRKLKVKKYPQIINCPDYYDKDPDLYFIYDFKGNRPNQEAIQEVLRKSKRQYEYYLHEYLTDARLWKPYQVFKKLEKYFNDVLDEADFTQDDETNDSYNLRRWTRQDYTKKAKSPSSTKTIEMQLQDGSVKLNWHQFFDRDDLPQKTSKIFDFVYFPPERRSPSILIFHYNPGNIYSPLEIKLESVTPEQFENAINTLLTANFFSPKILFNVSPQTLEAVVETVVKAEQSPTFINKAKARILLSVIELNNYILNKRNEQES